MRVVWIVLGVAGLMFGCGGSGEGTGHADEPRAEGVVIQVEAPEPHEIPAPVDVASDTDWEGRTHNKDIEILGVLNAINPVEAYITAGFDRYGDRFSTALREEWGATRVEWTAARTLYDSCKERRAAGKYDKQLFLDMEDVWQSLVRTAVAGVQTKARVESELERITAE